MKYQKYTIKQCTTRARCRECTFATIELVLEPNICIRKRKANSTVLLLIHLLSRYNTYTLAPYTRKVFEMIDRLTNNSPQPSGEPLG